MSAGKDSIEIVVWVVLLSHKSVRSKIWLVIILDHHESGPYTQINVGSLQMEYHGSFPRQPRKER